MICLHGGILSHFDESKEEIIPFIKVNILNSLQLLAVAPRNCINLVNNDILNNIVLDCYNLYKRYIPSGKTKGFLEKINHVSLDKKIKKIIKKVYENNGLPKYFKIGQQRESELIASSLTDPKNTAGFLTTYFFRKNNPYYITQYSLHENAKQAYTKFNCGIVIMKDTNYYLAPHFYQKDGEGFELLNISSCPQRNYTLTLCENPIASNSDSVRFYTPIQENESYSKVDSSDDFEELDIYEGIEYSIENVSLYNSHNNIIKSQTINLLKIFIEKNTQKVYIKHLAGYNFLSSKIFIDYIKYYRQIKDHYKFTDIYGYQQNFINHEFHNFGIHMEMCNSLAIPLLKELYPINKTTIINREIMLNNLYNFELNSWFENDGYVCYQGFYCRNFLLDNFYNMKFFYQKKRSNSDAYKHSTRNLPLSPRKNITLKKSKKSKESEESKGWVSYLKKLILRPSSSSSSSSSSSRNSSSKNRPLSRNRRVQHDSGVILGGNIK
jgi:hypothetical protein